MPTPSRLGLLAALLLPLTAAAQSTRPAPLQCDTLATPETGLVDLVALGPGGAVAWTDGPAATSFHLWMPRQPARTVSRSGAGPGEFRLVSAMGWRGDTVWVTDARLNRMTAFTAGGAYVRSVPLPSRGEFVARDDSTFIGSVVPTPKPGDAIGDAPLAIGTVVPASGTVTRFLSMTPVRFEDPRILPTMQTVARIATNRDGTRWCAIANGVDGTTQLACVTNAGRVLFQSSLALTPRPVAPAVLDDEVATFARRMGAPPAAVTGQFSRPSSTSAAFALLVNGTTDLWLGRSRPADVAAVWDRIAFTGARLASRVLPGRYQVRAVDGDLLYAADTDADGLQALVRCRVDAKGS